MILNEQVKIVEGFPPLNYTGAAIDANYISLKGYGHCTIVIQTGALAGTAAAVTLNKATTVAAAGETAADIDYVYTNAAGATTDTYTKTAVTSDTFTLAVANSFYIIEVDPDTLGAYDCVQIAVATPGTSADNYSSFYILSEPRYAPGITALTD